MREAISAPGQHLNQRQRRILARELHAARRYDRDPKLYASDRTAMDYLDKTGGLSAFFAYVGLLPARHVLDLGAGSTRAAHQLQALYPHLTFDATVLSRVPGTANNLESDSNSTIYFTAAERMKHIGPEKYGGMLAVFSATYSRLPAITAANIDYALCPGGALKMVCFDQNRPPVQRRQRPYADVPLWLYDAVTLINDPKEFVLSRWGYLTSPDRLRQSVPATTFADQFADKGYSVHTQRITFPDNPYNTGYEILTAIKPGSEMLSTTARELYDKDVALMSSRSNEPEQP